jgi:tetrachloro-p-hydroquinone reductive dehalogenase
MMEPAKFSGAKPRLYQAPSSYYSMIARLALAEGGIDHESVFAEIHFRLSQQQPDYVRLNPGMTVPTLVLADRILDQSRDIAEYALGTSEATIDDETKAWLDLHYAYPVEQLTFGGLLARNPLARLLIPKRLEAIRRKLIARAAENPDLATVYRARAAAYAERIRFLDPTSVVRRSERRRAEAIGFMNRLEQTLRDGRAVLTPRPMAWPMWSGPCFSRAWNLPVSAQRFRSGRRSRATGATSRRVPAFPLRTYG